ncbi:MAG TPA: hypothetical protein VIF62_09220 [Labilithrix sp.]|jgi:hypothetical protein
MAKDDPQALAERLFTTFLAPLVLGGPMTPGKPFGGKNALMIGDGRAPSDADTLSQTQLARVRVARKLAPVDLFEGAPSGAEWAIAATIHDLVQATHPGFDALFRRSGPARILMVIEKTLERVPPPVNVGDALSRHSWFSHFLEIARTDVEVKWWTGSQTFLGTEPPSRLLAWPEMRRVQQTKTPRPLMDLPTAGSAVDVSRFSGIVETILTKTPLTDIATSDRATPAFRWTHENLSLCATRNGRTLVLRALAPMPEKPVDAALGRATRALFVQRAARALFVAIDLLRDRALVLARARLTDKDPEPMALGPEPSDAAFAVSAGALAASHWIAQDGGGFSEAERKAILAILAPAASSAAAREVRALLPG